MPTTQHPHAALGRHYDVGVNSTRRYGMLGSKGIMPMSA